MQAIKRASKIRTSSVYYASKRFQGGFVPSDMPLIKRKWRSVDIVGKITETMRNVAAGKLPSAERWLQSTRPFAATVDTFLETTKQPSGINKTMHVVVGCERGLCGAVGSIGPKAVTKAVKLLEKSGECMENEVIVLGKKSQSKTRATLGDRVLYAFNGMKTKLPTMATCLEMVDKMKDHEYDKIIYYYSYYKNSTTFQPQTIELYNIAISEQIQEAQFSEYDLEGDEAIILQNFYDFKQASILFSLQAENLSSEMGSRLQSMDGAAKTCKEKSEEYEKVYQRLRKTKITNELTVLSTGAKLAKKKD